MSRCRSSLTYNQLLIAHIISKTIFKKYLPPVGPKLVPKLTMLRIYWNLTHLIFRVSQCWNFDVKDYFYQIFSICLAQICPKIKRTQNLLKFGTLDILNIPVLILMSKIIFMKYLPSVRRKLVPKLKRLRIYWNSAQFIFRIFRSRFDV